jgi:hypothetical protein
VSKKNCCIRSSENVFWFAVLFLIPEDGSRKIPRTFVMWTLIYMTSYSRMRIFTLYIKTGSRSNQASYSVGKAVLSCGTASRFDHATPCGSEAKIKANCNGVDGDVFTLYSLLKKYVRNLFILYEVVLCLQELKSFSYKREDTLSVCPSFWLSVCLSFCLNRNSNFIWTLIVLLCIILQKLH